MTRRYWVIGAGAVALAWACGDQPATPAAVGVADGGATGTGGGAQQGCASGQTLCDGSCVDLNTNNQNCGACGTACPSGNGCAGGVCTCLAGLEPCGNECTDLSKDPANCGACGNACGATQGCVAGSCACPAGYDSCGADCVNLAADPANCGSCGNICPTGQFCQSGACLCQPGLTACTTGCVDVMSDASNCGACDMPCATGQVCSLGQCEATCAAQLTQCATSCVDVLSSPFHCGTCDNACRAGQTCSGGSCGCPATHQECSGQCADVSTDLLNCGGCGIACSAGQSCIAGVCTCPQGQTDCSGTCADLQADPANCGSCGIQCATDRTCAAGVCTGTVTGTGGAGTGGEAAGGAGTGGLGTGGAATGGNATGGEGTGGDATGGLGTGGEATGGDATGGDATGGEGTGGDATGGDGTGGEATGGEGTGGEATGGADPGDPCEIAASCGTHKWPCWRMPNPAGSGYPNEASYEDVGDVIHDNITCLDWQKSPPGDSYTNASAISYCESLSLGGYDDWRLPTRVEMTSIVDWTRSSSIDPVFDAAGGFHKTGSNWILTITQTGAGAGTDYAWAFNMSDGIVSNAYSAGTAATLRCVRGNGTGEGFNDPAVAPPDQYTILSDDEALDNYTRLIWQRDGDATGLVSWNEAVSYCEGLSLGGSSDWRLPSVRELATLVDEAEVAPSINEEVFPNTHYGARSNNWYWAGHQARSSSASWGLNFDDGFTGFNSGAAAWNTFGPSYTKCVRDE